MGPEPKAKKYICCFSLSVVVQLALERWFNSRRTIGLSSYFALIDWRIVKHKGLQLFFIRF